MIDIGPRTFKSSCLICPHTDCSGQIVYFIVLYLTTGLTIVDWLLALARCLLPRLASLGSGPDSLGSQRFRQNIQSASGSCSGQRCNGRFRPTTVRCYFDFFILFLSY